MTSAALQNLDEPGATWKNMGMQLVKEKYGEAMIEEAIANEFPTDPASGYSISFTTASLAFGYALATFEHRRRPTHTTCIGGYAGKAVISADPRLPKSSLFKNGKTYKAVVRHSNAVNRRVPGRDDAMASPRGMAIRLGTDFDLVMNTGVSVTNFNADSMAPFLAAFTSGSESLYVDFSKRYPHVMEANIDSWKRAPSSMTNLHYYTQQAVRFVDDEGNTYAAKFRSVPMGKGPGSHVAPPWDGQLDEKDQRNLVNEPPPHHMDVRLPGETRDPEYLTEDMKARVSGASVVQYRLQIQLHPLPKGFTGATRDVSVDHSIFNNWIQWDEARYPWMDFATVTLDTFLPINVANGLDFSLPDMPDGTLSVFGALSSSDFNSVNAVRVRAYRATQRMRRRLQRMYWFFGCARAEDDEEGTQRSFAVVPMYWRSVANMRSTTNMRMV
mmetsp:Transcript_11423/g.33889  ORF Transcript_11423/g.33889 Transcript_11423/m.33889 type:complete len:442 (-) Transcript_11423:474-1799(-)